jgi:hypothetical protein
LENKVTEITSVAAQLAYFNIGSEVLRRFNSRNCLSVEPLPAARSPTSGWSNDQARTDAVMIRATTAVFKRAARRNEAWAAGDIGELLHSLARALFDPYRPELHYMRGPGPKWHAMHDRPNQPEPVVAALPLTPTHPSNALAAPVLIRCA